MIVLRDKNFSFLDKLTSIFKSGKEKTNTSSDNVSIQTEPEKVKIKAGEITFKDLYNTQTYPSLISMGLRCEDPVKEMELVNNWMIDKKIIEGGRIKEVYRLSDNVRGNGGLTVYYIVFTPTTKINSGARLMFADKLKWTEDFTDLNNSYHTWYKTSRNL